ncbi:YciI family protein [Actinomadura sp. KC06]|uniref:YciI family protein n=1 Tax=Actinomadura sp. KC06 TaxID=2530369 RepID=UPI001FB57A0E|nr:YciI family protein [Actinomadura sp. KC06]
MIMLYASQRDYDEMAGKVPEGEALWTAEDLAAMGAFMERFNQDLVESGEFVDANGLAAPVHTRRFHSRDGVPVVTDGPYPETAEVLAGYTIIECDSFDRASEITARLGECPVPAGAQGSAYADLRPIVDGRADLEG